ncbi:PREDICTED: sorting and assembly machinery component 50 homolog A [Ceratosolen solmsi marchali]|uniref:Sorting and assembly machinery component 50 homolog A n=1 Tax=Ceratosolen solmsi marchali TaxID=326594 RepID=A0AAJ6YDI2_9HYME|nr:PREDICTED: sorting and assembly machinery component 50 homolog A [Ceratosolen solmsi marchali]
MKSKTKILEDPNETLFNNEQLFTDDYTIKSKSTNFKDIKTRVDKIHIDGVNRTKHDILTSQVKELFGAKNFEDVIFNSYKVLGKLKSLECFNTVEVHIDTSHGIDSTPEGVEVTFKVRELNRVMGKINTMFGNNEASLHIGTKAPNLFGRAEKLQIDYVCGHKNLSNINISATKPFFTEGLQKVLTASIYDTSSEYSWSGYKQNDKGFLLDFAFNVNEYGILKQNLQYEAVVREVKSIKQAPFQILEQCGPTLKSCFRYICNVDKRDQSIFPSTGNLLQITTEVAGCGGNIGFLKSEAITQTNWSPHESITFQLSAQVGILREMSNDLKINIVDKFFLGGPLNIRGFDIRGCGPKEQGYSVGGNTYWAIALHLYSRLPFVPRNNNFSDFFRLHGFVNGGNVYNISSKTGNNYEEHLKMITQNIRCAAGCGIAFKLGNAARVELNFCLPLKFHRSDVHKQIQLGLGLQYL